MKSFKNYLDLVEAYNQHINTSNIAGLKGLLAYLKKEYSDVSEEFPIAIDDKSGNVKIKPSFEKAGLTIAAIRTWAKEKNYDIKFNSEFGEGSKSKGGSSILSDFGISNNTMFIEFFQAFGFFVKKLDLKGKDFKNLASIGINGDFKLLGNNFKGFIEKLDEHPLRKDAIDLANGSYQLKKELGIKNPYVVWDGIKDYYSSLLEFEEGIEFTKDNTSDIVVIEGTDLSGLQKSLKVKNQTISISGGKLQTTKAPKVSWYQVSLKESESGARLGRLTTQLKNKYLGQIGLSNLDVALGVEESTNYDDEITLNEFVELYNEGWFDNVKTFAKDALDNIRDKISTLFKWIISFKKTIISKLKKGDNHPKVKKLYNEISDIVKSEQYTGNYVERVAKYKASLVKEEKISFFNEKKAQPKKLSKDEEIAFIVSNKNAQTKFKKLVKSRLDDIIANNKKGVYKNISRVSGTMIKAKINKSTIKFNLGNSISFVILNEIINDIPSKNIMEFLSGITDDMLMGSTNYPIIKLYGTGNSSADYKVLTRTTKTAKASAIKDMYPFIVDIHPASSGNYYVINFYMLSKPDGDKEKSIYNMVQMTNAGAGFAYKIEGNKSEEYGSLKKKFGL